MNSATKYLAVLLITLGMSSAYLLDGPSEIEAMQDTSAEVNAVFVATSEVTR